MRRSEQKGLGRGVKWRCGKKRNFSKPSFVLSPSKGMDAIHLFNVAHTRFDKLTANGNEFFGSSQKPPAILRAHGVSFTFANFAVGNLGDTFAFVLVAAGWLPAQTLWLFPRRRRKAGAGAMHAATTPPSIPRDCGGRSQPASQKFSVAHICDC